MAGDYYQILGVSRDASKEELKRSYRRLARKYHPDVNRGPEAEAKFKEINEAHEVLKDPEKRAAVEASLSRLERLSQFLTPGIVAPTLLLAVIGAKAVRDQGDDLVGGKFDRFIRYVDHGEATLLKHPYSIVQLVPHFSAVNVV